MRRLRMICARCTEPRPGVPATPRFTRGAGSAKIVIDLRATSPSGPPSRARRFSRGCPLSQADRRCLVTRSLDLVRAAWNLRALSSAGEYRRFESDLLRHLVRGCGDCAPDAHPSREIPAIPRGFARATRAHPNRRLGVSGLDGAPTCVFLCCQVGRFAFAPDSPQRELRRGRRILRVRIQLALRQRGG